MPKDLTFFNPDGSETIYAIEHEPINTADPSYNPYDTFLIICSNRGVNTKFYIDKDMNSDPLTHTPRNLDAVHQLYQVSQLASIQPLYQAFRKEVKQSLYSKSLPTKSSKMKAFDPHTKIHEFLSHTPPFDNSMILSLIEQSQLQGSVSYQIELTPKALFIAQEEDEILSEVITWVKNKETLGLKLARIHPILRKFYNIFQLLEIRMFQSTTTDDTDQYPLLIYNEPTDKETKIIDYFGYGDLTEPKIVLPARLVLPVFNQTHHGELQGHPGYIKTLNQIRKTYYFSGLAKWTLCANQGCLECQAGKHQKKQKAPMSSPSRDVVETFDTLHMDFKGKI